VLESRRLCHPLFQIPLPWTRVND